ncbi:MAG: outer membrane protein assembly factor BamA [Polaribacter sp.]|jgi:outer membrane protein assembly factor BamA
MKTIRLLTILLFCWNTNLAATEYEVPEADSSKQKNYKLIVLPLVAFTPETNWIFGAAGNLSFRFKGESPESRPSQVLAGGAYTLKKQILSYLNYQLFFRQEQYKLYGEFGYYRYMYPYFGVGNELENELENYEALYPRVRINVLYLICPKLYGGLRYWMDNFNITDTQEDGLLESTEVTGAAGGLLSGLGLVFNYDSRDNIFAPSKGSYAELVLFNNAKTLGSDFSFAKYTLDASAYFSNKWKQTLALNVYSEFTFGEVPFNQMALLGGTKRMRGYIEGRFRDKQMLILQGEYRIPLFWRMGAVVFAGMGRVGDKVEDLSLDDLHFNYGGGIRFMLDEKEKLNLRLDVGVGEDNVGFYLTFGEAF